MALHRIGNYELLGELGRGGMGVVYRGVDSFIKRPVAIKTIYLSEIQDLEERQFLKQRLYREAQSAGILSHPNIVTIYQIGEQDEITYIAMEYVEGGNLAEILRKPEKPTLDLLLGVFEQTAAGLDHAHHHGVIHRDVKPANIIVRPDGVAKITDFGVAKISAQSVTRTGMTLGTPHFMAPEQIQGKQIDGKADQYSLGVVMYEILTGKKPFTADSMTTLIFRIVSDPVDPKKDNPRINDSTADVLKRALAKNPEDRFPNCSALSRALRESISGGVAVAGLSGTLPIPTPTQGTSSLQAPPPTASMPIQTPHTGTGQPPQGFLSQSVVTPHGGTGAPYGGTTAPPRPGETHENLPLPSLSTSMPTANPTQPWNTKQRSGSKWLGPAVVVALFGAIGVCIAIFYLLGGASLFSSRPMAGTQEQFSQPSGDTSAGAARTAGQSGTDSASPQVAADRDSPSSPISSSIDPIAEAKPQSDRTGTTNPTAAGTGKEAATGAKTGTSATGAGVTNRTGTSLASSTSGPSLGNAGSGRQNAGNIAGGRRAPQISTGRSQAIEATPTGAANTIPDAAGNASDTSSERPRTAVVTSPRPVTRVPAIYPAAARRDGVSGTVGLRAVINTKGEPTNIEVTKGIRPDLDAAAKSALSRWRFQPGTSGGPPIDAPVNVEISFNLVQDQRRPASLRNP